MTLLNKQSVITIERLENELINEREDNKQYQMEYEKIKSEGSALYVKFFGRGERIKELTTQNARYSTATATKVWQLYIA